MSDFIKRMEKVEDARANTNDPAELQKLDYIEEQIREDYRQAVACGIMEGVC